MPAIEEIDIESLQLKAPEQTPGWRGYNLEDMRRALNDAIADLGDTINLIVGSREGSIGAGFDGGGSVVEAGATVEVVVPFNGTITSAVIIANIAGSIEFEVEKSTYANYDTMTSIVASAPPTVSSAIKSVDTTLTDWTTTVTAGDVYRFSIVTASTMTRVIVVLLATKGVASS